MSTPPIQMSGLASGLDTQSIISQLMAVERLPRQRITLHQAAENARQAALTDLQTRFSSLKLAVTALSSAATWGDTQTGTSSDTAKVGVTVTGGAAPGGFAIGVQHLARAEQHTYAFTPQGGASALTVAGQSVQLGAGATVTDAAAAVNSANLGVSAVAVNGRLVLSSRTTGAASAFSASGAALAEDATAARAGLDAAYTIDGVAHTSASNVVTDGLAGVTLTLGAPTASDVGVTITAPGPDSDGIIAQVKAFVDAYNSATSAARTKLTERRVPNAANATDASKGVLFGDTGISGQLDNLRGAVGALQSLGISTGGTTGAAAVSADAVAGKLVLDTDKLRAALSSDAAGVRATLTTFATSTSAQLETFSGAGGVLDKRLQSGSAQLRDLADALTRFDDRMSQRQDYLQKQFTALEGALQANQSNQSAVSQLLA